MTMFVGCPEGCRYNTASAVYDLVCFNVAYKKLSDLYRNIFNSTQLGNLGTYSNKITKLSQHFRFRHNNEVRVSH